MNDRTKPAKSHEERWIEAHRKDQIRFPEQREKIERLITTAERAREWKLKQPGRAQPAAKDAHLISPETWKIEGKMKPYSFEPKEHWSKATAPEPSPDRGRDRGGRE